jgi:hypothetical protein
MLQQPTNSDSKEGKPLGNDLDLVVLRAIESGRINQIFQAVQGALTVVHPFLTTSYSEYDSAKYKYHCSTWSTWMYRSINLSE